MGRKPASVGTCNFCGQELTSSGMTKHLNACTKRQEQIAAADAKKGEAITLLHLRVKDRYRSEFWLDLEMRGTSKLKDLDAYLRGIWLECCGHLSQFAIGKGWGQEVGMQRTAMQVFAASEELTHIYDFGSSSETLVKCIGTRLGKPLTPKPLVLMARNNLPEVNCIECGEPATHLCMECIIEDQTDGFLCAKHTKKHPHDDYGEPIKLVNSPRLGVCGYDGPAKPPY